MVFLSEFLSYLIKFIALGIIAFAGIKCGIMAAKKKNDVAEASQADEKNE